MDDTHPDIHALQIRLYRNMSPARKAELIDDEWRTMRLLAIAGIRSRFPECSEEKVQEELANLLLGRELADRVRTANRTRKS